MAGANLSIGIKNKDFTKGTKEIATELKQVQSQFNLASTKAKLYGTATDQLKVKQQELTSKLSLQEKQISLTKDRINTITTDIDKYKNRQGELTTKIDETNKKYKESVEATGKNSEESKKLKAELDSLNKEYDKNDKAIDQCNKQLKTAETQLNNTEAAVLETRDALGKVTQTIKDAPFDDLAKKFDKIGDKAIDLGKKMSVVSAGIVGIGAGAIAAYKEVDVGMDNIVKATGATGEAAKEFENNYKNVASSINEDFGTIGSTLGEVNTRFGFTGEEVEKATEKFLQFARINNTDATQAVQLVSRAMGDAGIEAKDYGKMLDQLTVAAQASGIDINKLTELCTKYGAPMRALGLDTKESIAIFAGWELAGVNTEIAFSGMKAAIGKWGKEGKDAGKEFKKTLAEIEKAPNIAAATAKAIEVFGIKAGPDLADAIQGGRFEYSKFLEIIEGSEGAVSNTFNEITDGTDQAEIAMQAFKVASADLGEEILTAAAPIISGFSETVKSLSEWFRGLDSNTKQIIIGVGGLVAAIGPALIIFGAMSKGVSNIITGFKDVYNFGGKAITQIKDFGGNVAKAAKAAGTFALNLAKTALNFGKTAMQAGIATVKFIAHKVATLAGTIATNGLALAQAALNFIMSLNPITLIIIAIGALVAAIVVLWNKCEWFRELVLGMFEGLKLAWDATLQFFKSIWDWFVGLWNTAVEGFKAAWQVVCDFFKLIWQGVCLYFETVWNFWKGVFDGVVGAIKLVWEGACTFFKGLWEGICNTFKTLWDGFKTAFNTIVEGIKTIWTNVCNFFSTAWTGACNGIKSVFTGVKNTVVGIAQSMTNTVIRAINWCINQLNKIKFSVPDWVPLIGGKSWGVNIPTVAEVSWLYKGGIIDRPTFLGGGIGVGDNYKGTGRQAEAIIPLEVMYAKMKKIVDDSLVTTLNINKNSTNPGNNSTNLNIENFYNNRELDIEQLVKELEFYRKKYA